jgi:hypothetical protein
MKAKHHLLAILFLLCTSAVYAQNELFEQNAGMDDVTSDYISKTMFDMIPAIGDIGLSLTNLKGKVESLQLVSSEQTAIIGRMRNDFVRLVGRRHQELMRIRDGKMHTIFYADMSGDQVKDFLMLADSDSSYTAIRLTGHFTLKDIQNIAPGIRP